MEVLLTLSYALPALFALLFLIVMHRRFWVRHYRLDTQEDEVHSVVCDDEWEIRLYRYRGRASDGFKSNPVVVSHGFCANRFNVDFHPEASLARHLHSLGFDVWLIGLRGCTDSTRRPPQGRRRGEVLFEDFVDLDMPAAIRHVLAHSGADGVHWVGHSMGGMIGLAFAQGGDAPLLKSLTAIGSPARLELHWTIRVLCRFAWLVGWMRELPVGLLAQLAAPFYFRLPVDPVAIRQANLSPVRVRRAMTNVLSDMPMALTRQLARMQIGGGDVIATRDDRNFTAGLSKVDLPLLCIAGTEDRIAPASSVRPAVEEVSSRVTRWEVLGEPGTPPYGHGDLLIGDMAPTHVFPLVANWLVERAGVADELGLALEADTSDDALPAGRLAPAVAVAAPAASGYNTGARRPAASTSGEQRKGGADD